MKVGILGGGLTGLTLGYLLHQRGLDFEILEKENDCGGLMRTLVEDGFTFDYGGAHILFSKDMEALSFMLDLLGDNKVLNKRNTKILCGERYVKYPFENGLSDLPAEENFECLLQFIKTMVKKEKGELRKPRNLNEWFYYTFGRGMAEKYMVPYNEKIWKFPTKRISLEWVERIPNPPVEDIIRSSLGIPTEGYTHQLNFYYPTVGGIQAVIRAIEEKLKGHVSKRFNVSALRREGSKWIVSSNGTEERFDRVISTMPIHDLINALKDGGIRIPSAVQRAVQQLKYNSLITVMLGLETSELNDISWLYIPDGRALAHKVSFPSNLSPRAAPEHRSSVLAEITCNYGDEVWEKEDKDLIGRTISDLEERKIIVKDSVCFSKVKRSKYAYVISDLNFKENFGIIDKLMQRIGIELLGRFSEFKYMNMDACVRRAIDYTKNTRL
nr:FAD-dependent oxidoreductase [Candidatus Njordarchaeum guaymaensis]